LTSLLKLWFRELPEPIIPLSLYLTYCELSEGTEIESILNKIKTSLDSIEPVYRKYIIQHLMHTLYQVSLHHEVTRMTPNNLGIVFGPNLIKKIDDSTADFDTMASDKRNDFIAFLIEYYEELFKDIEAEREKGKVERQQQEELKSQRKRDRLSDEDVKDVEFTVPTISEEAAAAPLTPITVRDSKVFLTKEGWLLKKSGTRGNWTKRWFVLRYKTLSYFKSPLDTKPKGRIVLSNCMVGSSTRKPFCFCISAFGVENRAYLIVANNEQEKMEWVNAIMSCIEQSSADVVVYVPGDD